LHKGETLALAGASGSGKSTIAHAILQLNPSEMKASGEILLQNENLLRLPERDMQHVRGRKIGIVFQNPMTCLNPTMKIGKQIVEGLIYHEKISGKEARERAIEFLDLVKITNPKVRVDQYPHELSGGMRQRVMIAMATACRPEIVIADEATSSLDRVTQTQIIELLKEIQNKTGVSLLLITHDLRLVSRSCDRVLIMQQGEIVESGFTKQIFESPTHTYTKALMEACYA